MFHQYLFAMKKIYLIAIITTLSWSVTAQKNINIFELIFTAVDNDAWIQLDSINIVNKTQACDTTLYWPDTVLTFIFTGIYDRLESNGFILHQNYPNPVVSETSIGLDIPDPGKVQLIVTDIMGRTVTNVECNLERGSHQFAFRPGGEEFYLCTAIWEGYTKTIKILNMGGASHGLCSIQYMGVIENNMLKSEQATTEFVWSIGDEMLFIGNSGGMESGMLDILEGTEFYTFQFATNIPCPGTPTVDYEGHIYNTIQIFSQCWLKENLNVGTMIDAPQEMTDNGIIEKYCYNNIEDSCTIYGGLYQWNELMQYVTTPGAQGICPPGWHVPTDEEWIILEGSVDSQFPINSPVWDTLGPRGFDNAKNLKSTTGWIWGNGTNLFGFNAIPGGLFYSGSFQGIREWAPYFSSTQSGILVRSHTPCAEWDGVYRDQDPKSSAPAVRCVKN